MQPHEPARFDVVDEDGGDKTGMGKRATETLDRLQKMHADRVAEKEKRQQAKMDDFDPNESISQFLAQFKEEQEAITVEITKMTQSGPASGAAGVQNKRAIEGLAGRIGALEERTSQASYFLPPFEQRSCAGYIQGLRQDLEACKSKVVPQKKFSFGKSVTRTAADTLASSAQSVQVPSEALSPRIAGAGPVTPSATHSGRVVHGRVGETILLGPKELDGIDVTLSGLEACTVVLLGSLGAIRLDRIRKCCVVAASVKGSVFLEGVEDCKLFLASRQIRMHDSMRCDLYLRVKSRPIVEHCRELRFAPLTQHFPGRNALLKAGELAEETGKWHEVEDFGWIKAVQSPNWRVLDEAEREQTLPVDSGVLAEAQRLVDSQEDDEI